ncbi:hypothetical protein BH10PSE4_BH10PSE4_11340 [soil metagenome]
MSDGGNWIQRRIGTARLAAPGLSADVAARVEGLLESALQQHLKPAEREKIVRELVALQTGT